MTYRQSPIDGGYRNTRWRTYLALSVASMVAVAAVLVYVWHPWSNSRSSGGGSTGGSAAAASSAADAKRVAQQFAAAWQSNDFSGVPFAPPAGGAATAGSAAPARTGADVQASFDSITKGLHAVSVQATVAGVQPLPGNANGDQAVLEIDWHLPGGSQWKYRTGAELLRTNDQWSVRWDPAVVQPKLAAGDALRYTGIPAHRGTILDGAGKPLFTDQPVVAIGVEPSKTPDASATASKLGDVLHIDAAGLLARIKAAKADQFVDVITLRQGDYAKVADAVTAVPGVVLQHNTMQLSPTHDFARALLGTVGPVTKEIVDSSGGRYVAGDVAGLSGLQREFDGLLAGTPGYRIDIVHPSANGSTPLPTPIISLDPKDGGALRTTLDQRVQEAADGALGSVTDQPTALVAIQVSTGKVLAVANGPAGGSYDTALLGQTPPGSAFKVVTTLALLERGLDVNAPVACPPIVVVQGKTFHNFEGEQLGDPPFHTDFARSCNTAFIGLSSKVGGSALPDAARALGIGACWSVGTPAFHGQVPQPAQPVDLAATAFGQGDTQVSPISLAVAATSVARGSFLPPRLVLNGKAADCSSPLGVASGPATPAASPATAASASSAAPASPSAKPLPPGPIRQLRSLMREVVTAGTAPVLAHVPGAPVMAKTGTAEYGGGAKPKTHAWLIGYQGDIAFAVYAQDGVGGTTAAPLAAAFLKNLAGK